MYTLYLSLGVGLFVALVPLVFGVGIGWTFLPGMIVGVLAFVWTNRRVAKRVEAVTQAADAEMAALQGLAQRPGKNTAAAMANRFDRAVEVLKRGFMFEKWQIGVSTMLNARIGTLLFTKWLVMQQVPDAKSKGSGLADAIPYLEKARLKGRKAQLLQALWPAWAMLAVAYYKGRKDLDGAVRVLEDAVKVAKKQGMLWSLYAWILWKEERLDDAIAVLARGKEAAADDKNLGENLTALQNRKKMNMRGYGEQWYQFGLERPKMAGMQPQMGHPRMRGGARRR